MVRKGLTANNTAQPGALPLTSRNTVPFYLSINHQLENNYEKKNKKLNKGKLSELHAFIDKAVGKSISDVESLYKRKTDTNDTYGASKKQIIHFGFGKNFRIHGFYNSHGYFELCRLDPDHDKHS